jgi:hypothetical protein
MFFIFLKMNLFYAKFQDINNYIFLKFDEFLLIPFKMLF